MSIPRTILIADDDLQVRLGVAEYLRTLGLRTLLAGSGTQAWDILNVGGIHLAVLDHRMPGRTGLEIVTAIRERDLGVPSILCSGDAGDELREQALAAGAFAVLRKPVEPARLRSEVLRALDLSLGSGPAGP